MLNCFALFFGLRSISGIFTVRYLHIKLAISTNEQFWTESALSKNCLRSSCGDYGVGNYSRMDRKYAWFVVMVGE